MDNSNHSLSSDLIAFYTAQALRRFHTNPSLITLPPLPSFPSPSETEARTDTLLHQTQTLITSAKAALKTVYSAPKDLTIAERVENLDIAAKDRNFATRQVMIDFETRRVLAEAKGLEMELRRLGPTKIPMFVKEGNKEKGKKVGNGGTARPV